MTTFLENLVQRHVVANVLMIAILIGGLYTCMTIRQEVLPAREERAVEVLVVFPGAIPSEIETSVLIPIENAIRGISGIKHVDAETQEGAGIIRTTLLKNADPQQVLSDVKNAVDRLGTLPQDAEDPIVSIPLESEKVMSIIIHGDQPRMWLRRAAEKLRDDLRTEVGLTKVELAFPGDQEISVEVPESAFRQYDLSLNDIADRIKEGVLELPGGTLYSEETNVSLRTSCRREWAADYDSLVIASSPDGLPLRLSQIASVKDGFGLTPLECWFNGKPAYQLDVYAVGEESPISVEQTVQEYLNENASSRYDGLEIEVFENAARDYRSRRGLLINNALIGLVLVLLILGLFLTPNLAFWVLIGIPTALLGGLMLTPLFGATFNMLSMFAFIVTIGVVVDDAIMVAEAIHTYRVRGLNPVAAAVAGLKEIGIPVLLATVTTIIAFMPMFFVPGEMGVLFKQISAVVVAVLIVSLLEAVFILVAHLVHSDSDKAWITRISMPQQVVNARLNGFIDGTFRNFLQKSLQRPAILVATAISAMLLTIGAVLGGLLEFSFTPTIASDTVIAQATLPYGTPRDQAARIQQRLVDIGQKVLQENGMKSPGIFSCIGARLNEGEIETESLGGFHYVSVLLALPPLEERTLSGYAFAQTWREAFGDPVGLEAISFTGEKNMTGGEPVRLDVSHRDLSVARRAAIALGDEMRKCSGLVSVDDGIRVGKPELRFKLKDNGIHMGLTTDAMARQVRHCFHGAEALRFVREGNEIRVMVRLDKEERTRRESIENMLLKTPKGTLVPLTEVATIIEGQSFTKLARRDGRRVFPVTADIRVGVSDNKIEGALEDEVIPAVEAAFPGISIRFGGEEAEVDEALGALGVGFLVALGIMFFLISVRFNSYRQPLMLLSVIPFSFIGAIWGHILLGYDLSIVSIIGMIAMAGVVVNNSIVLVDAFNRYRADNNSVDEVTVNAACRRFRPILMTTLTTFFGLAPLMLETSEQAQFLIPAAISIGFGLLFGTLITLTIVPVILHWVEK